MQVGSLVECIDVVEGKALAYARLGIRSPQKNKIYTVRDIIEEKGRVGIRLEEIVNPEVQTTSGIIEVAWLVEYFRELMPPMTISLEELIGVAV